MYFFKQSRNELNRAQLRRLVQIVHTVPNQLQAFAAQLRFLSPQIAGQRSGESA